MKNLRLTAIPIVKLWFTKIETWFLVTIYGAVLE